MTATITTRRWRTWRAKRVAFVDPAFRSLADVLGEANTSEAERVFLTGPRVGETIEGFAEWYLSVPDEWEAAASGHYLESTNQHVLRYRHRGDGRMVEVHRAAAWFGEGAGGPSECLSAYNRLAHYIGAAFPGGVLLATPASTGRDLLVRSLGDRTYPLASAENQDLIRATSGQGRIELIRHASIDGLAEYDGRLMYAALCSGLGSGAEALTTDPNGAKLLRDFTANPYRRARYHIDFEVPAGWHHVGVLGVHDDGGGWRYPSAPGERGTTWADGSEVMVAVQSGWKVRFHQRLSLHEPVGSGPLRWWARRLALGRAHLAAGGDHLAANGVRAILLHSIGAFHGSPHHVTRTAPASDTRAVPAGARGLRIEGDSLVWSEARPPAWPELSHPEWSAAIWARCRARLLSGPGGLTGALHAPAGSVVAFRTDALYLDRRMDWPDDGREGRLRLKSWTSGPMTGPRNVAGLLALRDSGRAAACG